jgi:hypothetical protein
MNQQWYKSWAVWTSLAGLVAYIARTVFGQDIAPWLTGLLDVLLPVLIAFGIINNPNISNAWVGVPTVVNGMHETEGDDNAADE